MTRKFLEKVYFRFKKKFGKFDRAENFYKTCSFQPYKAELFFLRWRVGNNICHVPEKSVQMVT